MEVRKQTLEALRLRIARIERGTGQAVRRSHLPFGIDAIDRVLPQGGLARGAVHEVLGQGADSEHAAIPSLLVGILLGRPDQGAREGPSQGQVLWAMRGRDLFAPGLCAVGLQPDRLILVEAGRAVPDVMEEALRHPGLAGVVGEIDGRLGLTASRRLQLAAEASGGIGFAIRRSRRFDDPALLAPSAAASRWRIGALPSLAGRTDARAPEPVLGPARWRLELLRSRDTAPIPLPTRWILDFCDETHRLALADALADRPAGAEHAA